MEKFQPWNDEEHFLHARIFLLVPYFAMFGMIMQWMKYEEGWIIKK